MEKVKRLINFRKLINGHYDLQTEFEVFRWMLETGKKYEFKYHGWYHSGVNQLLFRYSANEWESYTDMLPEFRDFMLLGFVEALVRDKNSEIEAWRKGENISLNSSRYIYIYDTYPKRENQDKEWTYLLYRRNDYLNKPLLYQALNRYNCDDEVKSLGNPYIKWLKFSVGSNGKGYAVIMTYTFPKCPDSGWDISYCQKERSVSQFLFDTQKYLDSIVLQEYPG